MDGCFSTFNNTRGTREDFESGILNKTFKSDAGDAQNAKSCVYKLCEEGTKYH